MTACQAVTHMRDEEASCRCRQETHGDVCLYHAKMANGLIEPVTDDATTSASKPVLVLRADTMEVLWSA